MVWITKVRASMLLNVVCMIVLTCEVSGLCVRTQVC
jgi:hypothetical protein